MIAKHSDELPWTVFDLAMTANWAMQLQGRSKDLHKDHDFAVRIIAYLTACETAFSVPPERELTTIHCIA